MLRCFDRPARRPIMRRNKTRNDPLGLHKGVNERPGISTISQTSDGLRLTHVPYLADCYERKRSIILVMRRRINFDDVVMGRLVKLQLLLFATVCSEPVTRAFPVLFTLRDRRLCGRWCRSTCPWLHHRPSCRCL